MASKAGPVERATRARLRKLRISVQESPAAALAVAFAQQVDQAKGQMGTAQVGLQLRLTMEGLEATAERPEADAIDELNARRAVRRDAAG